MDVDAGVGVDGEAVDHENGYEDEGDGCVEDLEE